MVDIPANDRPVTPTKASRRLAILLRRGLLIFAGVIIIMMSVSKGVKLPDIECSDVIVGHTPDNLSLMGVGGSSPIYESRYEFVIMDIHVPLPSELTRKFWKSNRCG